MKYPTKTVTALGCLAAWLLPAWSVCCLDAAAPSASWEQADALYADGNYREALAHYEKLLAVDDAPASPLLVAGYQRATRCFQQLNALDRLDTFRETVVRAHPDDWQVLAAVAHSYLQLPHTGYRVAGEFQRGPQRGPGQVQHATARDRTRALQLHYRALQILTAASTPPGPTAAHWLMEQFAAALMHGNRYQQAWKLQRLTALTSLPDYESGWGPAGHSPPGAAVDPAGDPVFYPLPVSWQAAHNDGQRWRWILETAARWQPQLRQAVQRTRARFLQSQFGVETLASSGVRWGRPADTEAATGTWALQTLTEEETIARLATGVRRFALPEEHNHLKIYQQILANKASSQHAVAARQLANIFENRQQYDVAAQYWQAHHEDLPEGPERLAQIQGPWGRLEPVLTQPAGTGATVDFRFRNGHRVEFTAHRIRIPRLLADIKSYLRANPPQLEAQQLQLENLGHRLVVERQDQYLGQEVARWSLDLQPRERHLDRRITVTTPLEQAGAYLLTSEMDGGNRTSLVLWISDTALVKKPLANKSLYYVADALSGAPLADASVEFFGYWREDQGQLHTKSVSARTSSAGLVELPSDKEHLRHRWLAVATTSSGRLAYLGFRRVWAGAYYDRPYQQVKAFSITDRPLYRPGQTLAYKFWVRQAQYDLPDTSQFAGQSFLVEIRDPKNERVFSEQLTADSYGGLAGNWTVPAEARLGQYRIQVARHGGGTFRVEEYQKPEFAVTITAPPRPVQLGESFQAKISAQYYFGEPVTQARVRYRVLRTATVADWFPPRPWDWLYGPGYGWFAPDSSWYPGWQRWGCQPPWARGHWPAAAPPEVVAEQEVSLGPDGSVHVDIDSSLAAQLHPDQDHTYQIQAEVVDASRRTVVGHGRVFAARQPFRVALWTERGYYRVGDTIRMGSTARTLDGQPVAGPGTLRLLQVRYERGQPVETEVGRWDLATRAAGQAKFQIKAATAGQYRLAYEVTDPQGHKIEGGQLLTVTGENFDGGDFRFNDLELIPDRRTYRPGEQAQLQINSNREQATVLLFARPANGVYLPPQMIRLTGKSQIVTLDVTAADAPNFFVEAVTIHGGRVHTVTRELCVPPERRMLQLEMLPTAEALLPGQTAKILCKLTDAEQKPFRGSLVVTIYDQALEAISGGSQVAQIRDFFWKWRRSHRPQSTSNLQRYSAVQIPPDQQAMQDLGMFGRDVADPRRADAAGARKSERAGGGRNRWADGTHSPVAAVLAESSSSDMEPPAPVPEVAAVREYFADTALWVGSLETDAEGLAEVEFTLPDNLTTWQIRGWAMGHGTRVGEAQAEIVTRKNLLLRMQAPRFFVERDEVVLSAIVHNYLDSDQSVRVQLQLEDDTLAGPPQLTRSVEIPAGGEQRVDWRVRVRRAGTAQVTMRARADRESDAVTRRFPVQVHGLLQTESFTGLVPPSATVGRFSVTIPAQRRAEQTQLKICYTPSLAGTMLEALPFLLQYPHGCTEQTLNRFLPAVLVQRTLQQMGLDLEALAAGAARPATQHPGPDPIFNTQAMQQMIRTGLNRLAEMQLSDGGWGWFHGWGERSAPHTTAVVMHGLLVARQHDVAMEPQVLERGLQWLQKYQAQQCQRLSAGGQRNGKQRPPLPQKRMADDLDALVYMVLSEAGRAQPAMRDYLYRDRSQLSVASLATLGLALAREGSSKRLSMIQRNLSQYLRQDKANQTAWLQVPTTSWWTWHGSALETQAYYLKFLAAVEPDSAIAPRLVKYLVNNRRHATYWNSTRDTALVIEALADYLQVQPELAAESTVELWIDGQQRHRALIDREQIFGGEHSWTLSGDALAPGRHTVEIRKQGAGPLYWNGYLTNFTLVDPIAAAGLELKVARNYYRLRPSAHTTAVAGAQGQAVRQRVEKYERVPIASGAHVESGDVIEVELTITSKNDYEYLLLEDKQAAGCRPVDFLSGYRGHPQGAYVEFRDDRVCMYFRRLARGRHSLSYRVRAEIPGAFSVLPAEVAAMYAPQLKANSEELKIEVRERSGD